MAVSRRIFLRHTALVAAACVTVPAHGWGSTKGLFSQNAPVKGKHLPTPNVSKSDSDALAALTREHFSSAIGSGFKVSQTANDPQEQWLRLISVHDLPELAPVNLGLMAVAPKGSAQSIPTSGFMVSFTGASSTALAQGTYLFEHDRLGHFALFIVPAGSGEQSYSAVINRIEAVAPTTITPGIGTAQITPTVPVSSPAVPPIEQRNPAAGNVLRRGVQ
jgi:hypothetical protein